MLLPVELIGQCDSRHVAKCASNTHHNHLQDEFATDENRIDSIEEHRLCWYVGSEEEKPRRGRDEYA